VIMSVSNVMAGRVLIASRRASLLIGIAFSGLALNVMLNLLLIPHLGTAGAATATVTTEGVGALAVAWVAERKEAGSQPLALLVGAMFGVTSALLLWSWRVQTPPGRPSPRRADRRRGHGGNPAAHRSRCTRAPANR